MNSGCESKSVGPVNQLFSVLFESLLLSQCAISPENVWPKDYGPTALAEGTHKFSQKDSDLIG